MRTKLVEFTDGALYGKVLLGRFDNRELDRRSEMADRFDHTVISLLRQEGWGRNHYLLLDISKPGRGAIMQLGEVAKFQLAKHPPDHF